MKPINKIEFYPEYSGYKRSHINYYSNGADVNHYLNLSEIIERSDILAMYRDFNWHLTIYVDSIDVGMFSLLEQLVESKDRDNLIIAYNLIKNL
jgi:hypothetical protein